MVLWNRLKPGKGGQAGEVNPIWNPNSRSKGVPCGSSCWGLGKPSWRLCHICIRARSGCITPLSRLRRSDGEMPSRRGPEIGETTSNGNVISVWKSRSVSVIQARRLLLLLLLLLGFPVSQPFLAARALWLFTVKSLLRQPVTQLALKELSRTRLNRSQDNDNIHKTSLASKKQKKIYLFGLQLEESPKSYWVSNYFSSHHMVILFFSLFLNQMTENTE